MNATLQHRIAYYRAGASEYALQPTGSMLELACGTRHLD